MPLLRTKIIGTKFQEVKTGCNQAEFSKEDYGSKRAVLPVMMIIIYGRVFFPIH
jgi:hypothetical protein